MANALQILKIACNRHTYNLLQNLPATRKELMQKTKIAPGNFYHLVRESILAGIVQEKDNIIQSTDLSRKIIRLVQELENE